MKTFIAFLILLSTSSCGFKPLYQKNIKLLDYNFNIVVKSKDMNGKEVQIMKNLLSKKLINKNAKASSLKLLVMLKKNTYSLGLQKDLSTNRYAVQYNVEYVLSDRKGIITKGSTQQKTSFDIGANPYSNTRSEETSTYNLIKVLSENIALLALSVSPNRKIYP